MANRLRIKLKSYDSQLIEKASREIVNVARNAIEKSEYKNTKVIGPIPLPTKIKRYTVIRSPHIDKDSREQFELRIHKRLIDIVDPSQEVIDALLGLELSAGVDVELKEVKE